MVLIYDTWVLIYDKQFIQKIQINIALQISQIMITTIKHYYRVTKPRILTQNQINLNLYRKQLRNAQKRVYKQSIDYLNKIQDEFLNKHKTQLKQKHFDNQCRFRSKIARVSYQLYQSHQKQKLSHQTHLQQVQKYIKEEQIKKLNRQRIKKILQYQNQHFWITGEHLNEDFISNKVLPPFIATTEYYHKLHSEAMAYDQLNFDLLHQISSNQQAIEYKNKLLIPLYKQVLILMRQVKFTDEQRINRQYEKNKFQLTRTHSSNRKQLTQLLQQLKLSNTQQLTQLTSIKTNKQKYSQYIKNKYKTLILLLKKWKQYTNILNLTSAQIYQQKQNKQAQKKRTKKQKDIQKKLAPKNQPQFVNPKQQDSQDEQIKTSTFLSSNKQIHPTQKPPISSIEQQLETLLNKSQSIVNQISEQIIQKQIKLEKQKQALPEVSEKETLALTLEQNDLKIDQGFLNPGQTTVSVEVMKDMYYNDENMKNILNIVGEFKIAYPKLFKKIWETKIFL